MTFWWKLAAFCLFVTSVFGAGVYTEKKFSFANQVTAAYAALSKTQHGEMNIIKDQQKLESNREKNSDPCNNVRVPDNDSRVLY